MLILQELKQQVEHNQRCNEKVWEAAESRFNAIEATNIDTNKRVTAMEAGFSSITNLLSHQSKMLEENKKGRLYYHYALP